MTKSFLCPECEERWTIDAPRNSRAQSHCDSCGAPGVVIRGDQMKVSLVQWTNNPEKEIATRGSTSHGEKCLDIEEARELVEGFVGKGHYSTLEFADATFKVSGVSRSSLAQITRHRHASFMVKSQRYTDASKEDMVVPDEMYEYLSSEGEWDRFEDWREQTKQMFDDMVESGVPKEEARYLLPIGTETEYNIKANFREYRHIFSLRALNPHAQREIRLLTQRMLYKLNIIAPSVFSDQRSELG